jgi:hypothetical protein
MIFILIKAIDVHAADLFARERGLVNYHLHSYPSPGEVVYGYADDENADKVREWFAKGPEVAPFPQGSLLFFREGALMEERGEWKLVQGLPHGL